MKNTRSSDIVISMKESCIYNQELLPVVGYRDTGPLKGIRT